MKYMDIKYKFFCILYQPWFTNLKNMEKTLAYGMELT